MRNYGFCFLNTDSEETWRIVAANCAINDWWYNMVFVIPFAHNTEAVTVMNVWSRSLKAAYQKAFAKYYGSTVDMNLVYTGASYSNYITINGKQNRCFCYTTAELSGSTGPVNAISAVIENTSRSTFIISGEVGLASSTEQTIYNYFYAYTPALKYCFLDTTIFDRNNTRHINPSLLTGSYITTNTRAYQAMYRQNCNMYYITAEFEKALSKINERIYIHKAEIKMLGNLNTFTFCSSIGRWTGSPLDVVKQAYSMKIFDRQIGIAIPELNGKIISNNAPLFTYQLYDIATITLYCTNKTLNQVKDAIISITNENNNWIDGFNLYNFSYLQNINTKSLIYLSDLITQINTFDEGSGTTINVFKIPIIFNEAQVSKVIIKDLISKA